MLDQPHGSDILDAVARLLRDKLMAALPPDLVFQARVAANAVDLVAREMRLGPKLDAEAAERLRALLGHDGTLNALETELSEQIRSGAIGLQTSGLFEHLWETTLAKMSVDQPNYASYRREAEARAAHTESKPKE